MNMRRVFAALAGKVRRMTAGMREKPEVKIEDYELEHFLLYNGLVGSTEENPKEYRDVRNEIVQAVNDGSPHQMAIAFKALPPLWWEERLEKIFAEIATLNRGGAVKCLIAGGDEDDTTGDTTCLGHSNWKVRANAARMLAFLEVKEAAPKLARLLDQCQVEQKAAFCHLAYALAKLGSESSRDALAAHLNNSEPWFCVDAAGALAHWDLASVSADLMKAMLSGNILDDYMAVSIARRHRATAFAEHDDAEIQEGAAELALSLLKAVQSTFHSESGLKQQLEELQPRINELAMTSPSPRRLSAAISLNRYLDDQQGRESRKSQPAITDLSDEKHFAVVKGTLEKPATGSAQQLGQLKHALALASQFRLDSLSPLLVPLISEEYSPALPDLLYCAGALGTTEAAPKIASIVLKIVDLDKRCSLAFSAHPVVEADKQSSDIYWAALKALGSMPDKTSIDILSRAVDDHAPDKREQALLSLQSVLLSESLKEHYSGNLEELLRARTEDPAVGVQAAAIAGVAQHNLESLIPEVLSALHSREHAIQKRASDTLFSLANRGHRKQVRLVLEESMSKEHNSAKKHRMDKVLHRISLSE